MYTENRLSSQWLKTSLLVREVLGSILGLVKLDTVSPSARHRCDVSSELCRPGANPRRLIPPLVTRFGAIPRVFCDVMHISVFNLSFYLIVYLSAGCQSRIRKMNRVQPTLKTYHLALNLTTTCGLKVTFWQHCSNCHHQQRRLGVDNVIEKYF